jgi:hypothetical protein
MLCKSCGSDEQRQFAAEIAIHFPGMGTLNEPHVLVFPMLVVCMNCGKAGFDVTKNELRALSGPGLLRSDAVQSDPNRARRALSQKRRA